LIVLGFSTRPSVIMEINLPPNENICSVWNILTVFGHPVVTKLTICRHYALSVDLRRWKNFIYTIRTTKNKYTDKGLTTTLSDWENNKFDFSSEGTTLNKEIKPAAVWRQIPLVIKKNWSRFPNGGLIPGQTGRLTFNLKMILTLNKYTLETENNRSLELWLININSSKEARDRYHHR
jgi:hypothetical protein